jgi:UDP-N-acetylmuramate--alanine ligase
VLLDIDVLFLMDIYPAGEDPIEGVSSRSLYNTIKDMGHANVFYSNGSDNLVSSVLGTVRPGDVVITLGAGNVWAVGERIAEEIA